MHRYKKYLSDSHIDDTRANEIAEALKELSRAVGNLSRNQRSLFLGLSPYAFRACVEFAEHGDSGLDSAKLNATDAFMKAEIQRYKEIDVVAADKALKETLSKKDYH